LDFTIIKFVIFVVIATLVLVLLPGCSTVGSGNSTIVLAPKPVGNKYKGKEFSSLISSTSDALELRSTGDGKAFDEAQWKKLIRERFGVTGEQPPDLGRVSVTVRDRTRTPTFSAKNFDFDREDEVVKILLDPAISDANKSKLIDRARNNFVTLPEAANRVVFDRRYPVEDEDRAGQPQWRYFIELEVNLTGTLESADPSQTFSYLGAALRIPKGIKARFINFSPKEADLYEIAIGQLTSNAKVTGSVTSGGTSGNEGTLVDTSTEGLSDTSKSTSGSTRTTSTGFEISETLAREIKLGLDTRSTGIHDEGKVFLMELRGTDRKRIAGTYSYLVMLEVQSEAMQYEGIPDFIIAEPATSRVDLETRAVGVIRHVVDRGQTGIFNKVPEPLNDDTFNQVVVQDGFIKNAWRFSELPRGDAVTKAQKPENLIVRTGLKEANFYISDQAGTVLGYGTGTRETFSLATGQEVTVYFMPVIQGDSSIIELTANNQTVTIPQSGAAIVVGDYGVKSVHVPGQGR
jgi:hypothetical protein